MCSVEKCGCVEDVACAEIDESFSTQASDISEEASASGTVASAVRVKPWQYVEARRQARPTTPPSRLSTAQVVIKSHPGSQVPSRRPTQVLVPPGRLTQVQVISDQVTPTQVLSARSDVKAPRISQLTAVPSAGGLPQVLSPCSSTRSAPTLTESRSLVTLRAPRWSSATPQLPTASRVQVITAAVSSNATPVSTPRSVRTTQAVLVPPGPGSATLNRSQSWQPQATPQMPSQPMRYTMGAQALVSYQPPSATRPPMAQVVAVR